MSDQIPQHDPPRDGALIQPEVDARADSVVVEGDDAEHVLPPTELDPYTPDPAPPTSKARTALWLAVALVLITALLVVVIAAAR